LILGPKDTRRTHGELVAHATLIRHYEWRWSAAGRSDGRERGNVRLPSRRRCSRSVYASVLFYVPCECCTCVRLLLRVACKRISSQSASDISHPPLCAISRAFALFGFSGMALVPLSQRKGEERERERENSGDIGRFYSRFFYFRSEFFFAGSIRARFVSGFAYSSRRAREILSKRRFEERAEYSRANIHRNRVNADAQTRVRSYDAKRTSQRR